MNPALFERVRPKILNFLNPTSIEIERIRCEVPSFNLLDQLIRSNQDLKSKNERQIPYLNSWFELERNMDEYFLSSCYDTYWRKVGGVSTEGSLKERTFESRTILLLNPRILFISTLNKNHENTLDIIYPGIHISSENNNEKFFDGNGDLTEQNITVEMKEILKTAQESTYLNSNIIFDDSMF